MDMETDNAVQWWICPEWKKNKNMFTARHQTKYFGECHYYTHQTSNGGFSITVILVENNEIKQKKPSRLKGEKERKTQDDEQ